MPRHRYPTFLVFFLILMSWIALPASASTCCNCHPNGDATTNVCLTSELSGCPDLIQKSNNAALKDYTCDPVPLDPNITCKPISTPGKDAASAKCQQGPSDALSFKPKSKDGANTTFTPDVPVLNVPIPGVTFSTNIPVQDTLEGKKIGLPFIAEYIQGAYNYLILITVLAATIMIIYGGFLYIIGGTFSSITSGKKMIFDALIGLVLVYGAWTMLNVLNPQTTSFKAIYLELVEQNPYDIGQYSNSPPVGDAAVPAGTNTDSKTIAAELREGAKMAGIDPCIVVSICNQESRLRVVWEGIGSGQPKEKGKHFGACGLALFLIEKDCPPGKKCMLFSEQLRAKFPDFPPALAPSASPQEKEASSAARREWLLKNMKGNGYLTALVFQSGHGGSNEILKLASYSAGLMSVKLFLEANKGCTPKADLGVKAGSANPTGAIKDSCIPPYMAIAKETDGHSNCKDDKYVCADVSANKRSTYEGHCPSDASKLCYAMATDNYAKNVLQFYPSMISSYQCNQ